jgi:site-specific DNA-methyltransferase (adenine-specific)
VSWGELGKDPRVVYQDESVILLCARWQDVAESLPVVDLVCTDPPYSERTHKGSDAMADGSDKPYRRALGYQPWTDRDVRALVASLACDGWWVALTDDELASSWRTAYRDDGRYDFAPVPVLQHRPRLSGDGPASCAVYLMASRPRCASFMGWGSLPGWYQAAPERFSHVMGAKPIGLMRAIVRDYSRPGDLILDPCAGGGTTGRAARLEGRRCILIEQDPETAAKTARLLHPLRNPKTADGQTELWT